MSEIDVDEAMLEFVVGLTYPDVPGPVRERLALLLLDLMSVAVAGRPAPASLIAAEVAVATFGGDRATAWADGRRLSVAGAAFANGVLANVLDHDDGHRLTKGHPGAVVIPAAAAVAEAVDAGAEEFLLAVLIGYEVAIRAGVEQHARRPQYHGSGSWGALGAAAASARLLKLDAGRTRQALGLAEYHAPIALIMRSVAEPAMTKDGIGWGAQVGVTAALLAQAGFTGTESEFATCADLDREWGRRWDVLDLYVKPYPCCRWSQPAVQAALDLVAGTGPLDPEQVHGIEIRTFAAADALAKGPPRTTEEAQYSLLWPVACALALGRYGVAQALGGFDAPGPLTVLERTTVVVDPLLSKRFPAERLAEVTIRLTDGSVRSSGPTLSRGDPDDPGWADIVRAKAASLEPAAQPYDVDRPSRRSLGNLDHPALIALLSQPFDQ